MANETPESDFSIECFQNYTAPEVFVQGLAGMVDQTDVETIIRAQKNMLQRFEKTTEMLTNCNQLSASRLRAASTEFRKHTQLLLEMRKDLEFIFKKIRAIKTKLSTQYPEAYKAAVNVSLANKKPIDEEEEFKPTEPHTESKMVATVSTETLKPTVSEDKKKKKEVKIKTPKEEVKKVRSSSSSETESASSGDDSSTDTG
ncbi:kxDL motif-containing protein CG10681 [Leguminivora glycinivorella]|uniref:kxDL motif-containing protein CG10681 n=1 Tax=Leguminivora glycinivorella TaxID=1035111 RepID=UPI00200CB7A8|nr:kxDL motif-containing protein CG10681 [Leguminivora glycinivorella]